MSLLEDRRHHRAKVRGNQRHRERKGSHCVVSNEDLVCMHCKEKQTLKLPMDVSMWVRLSRAFVKAHEDCPKPKEMRS